MHRVHPRRYPPTSDRPTAYHATTTSHSWSFPNTIIGVGPRWSLSTPPRPPPSGPAAVWASLILQPPSPPTSNEWPSGGLGRPWGAGWEARPEKPMAEAGFPRAGYPCWGRQLNGQGNEGRGWSSGTYLVVSTLLETRRIQARLAQFAPSIHAGFSRVMSKPSTSSVAT